MFCASLHSHLHEENGRTNSSMEKKKSKQRQHRNTFGLTATVKWHKLGILHHKHIPNAINQQWMWVKKKEQQKDEKYT